MDIDMPFVLSWAVMISGGVWLADVLLLKPRRQQAAVALNDGGTAKKDVDRVLRESAVVEYARSFFPVLLLVLVLRSFLHDYKIFQQCKCTRENMFWLGIKPPLQIDLVCIVNLVTDEKCD